MVAVLVSLLIAAPPTDDHTVPLYPSNWLESVLNRKYPDTPVGCWAAVPLGSNTAPVPVNEAIPAILGAVAKTTVVPVPVVEYDVPHAEPVLLAIPAAGYVKTNGAAN